MRQVQTFWGQAVTESQWEDLVIHGQERPCSLKPDVCLGGLRPPVTVESYKAGLKLKTKYPIVDNILASSNSLIQKVDNIRMWFWDIVHSESDSSR